LRLKDRAIVKSFKQYPDRFYRLEKVEDLNGNELVFTREPSGALTEICRSDGLRLLFTNDGTSRRTSITLVGIDGARLKLARYSYDAIGRMVSADCAFGVSVRYDWHDAKPLLLRWRNQTRRSETIFTYDEDGRVLHTKTNGLWNDDRFHYDREQRLTTYVPASDERRAQKFEYDANENVTAEIDALSGAMRHTFNKFGFRSSTTDQNGHTVKTTYDIWGNVKRHTDAAGRDTIYGWGPEGQLDVVIDGAGNKRRNEYDGSANVVKEIDAEGSETRYVRDARGRIVETHFPDETKETRAYDQRGWLSSITDAKGGVTSFAYDSFGRLTATTDALGGVTRLAYEAGAGGFNTPTALTRPDGVAVRRAFDAEGTLASVTDGEGRTWTYTHGAFDILEAVTDPRGGRLSLSYDSEGRLIRVINANGATYEYERDVAGRVVAEMDFDGRVIRYERDAGGRIVAKTAPDGSKLVYSYDPSNLLTRIDAFETGEDGKLPEAPTSSESFEYDGRGLLIKAKNDACEVTLKRDRNGRIFEESQNHRRVVSRYDAVGRRVERALGFAEGWSASGQGPVGFQGFAAEDYAAGRIVSPYALKPPSAPAPDAIARYKLDPLGLLTELALGPKGDAERQQERLRFTRDALGRETKRANDRGFSLAQSFDAVGQLTGQSVRGFAGATRYDRSFAYDKAFSPTKIVDDLWGASCYTHDPNGQVLSARHGETDDKGAATRGASKARLAASPGFTPVGLGDEIFELERFQYDAARNVVASDTALAGEPINRPVTRWILSLGGKVKAARGPSGERIFLTHDGCGRVIERRIERDGFRPKVWRYRWNAFDRLVGCVTPEGERWTYSYDPFGRRVEKRLDASPEPHPVERPRIPSVEATRFTWDGDLIAEEIPLCGDDALDMRKRVVWHFEPGSFRPLARESVDDAGEERVHYVVTDHLGAPREVLAATGELQWAASYRLWGSLRHQWKKPRPAFKYSVNASLAFATSEEDEENLCPIRFPGQWQDDETGLYYNRYRHYDPLAGQYASPDPIGLAGGERTQAYAARPNAWVDPLGLASKYLPPDEASAVNKVLNQASTKPGGHRVYGEDALRKWLGVPELNNPMPEAAVEMNSGKYRSIEVKNQTIPDIDHAIRKFQNIQSKGAKAGVQFGRHDVFVSRDILDAYPGAFGRDSVSGRLLQSGVPVNIGRPPRLCFAHGNAEAVMSKNFYLHGVSRKHGIELIADVVKTMAKTYIIPFITINQPGLFTQPNTKEQLAVYKIYLRDHPRHDEDDFVSTSFDELKKLAATWSETYCCDIPIFDAKDIYICDLDIYLNKAFDKCKVSDFFKSTNFTIVGPSVKRQSLVEFISLLEPVFKSEHFLAGGISLALFIASYLRSPSRPGWSQARNSRLLTSWRDAELR
jgi:RHS repeat-associated protein